KRARIARRVGSASARNVALSCSVLDTCICITKWLNNLLVIYIMRKGSSRNFFWFGKGALPNLRMGVSIYQRARKKKGKSRRRPLPRRLFHALGDDQKLNLTAN